VKAGAHLKQRANAPIHVGDAPSRLGDARKDLEQRAFTGAVAADDPQDLAAPHLK
jgi:hypothetical protein